MWVEEGVYLTALQLRYYKSFVDTGELNFASGINVIAGPNSAGKTALLMGAALDSNPSFRHASETTKLDARVGVPEEFASTVSATIRVPTKLLTALTNVAIPVRDDQKQPDQLRTVLGRLGADFEQETVSVRVQLSEDGSGEVHPYGGNCQWVVPEREAGGQISINIPSGGIGAKQYQATFAYAAAQFYRQRVYSFKAERYKVGSCAQGGNPTLAPDASNLPEVLGTIQPNHYGFADYNALVSRVLPDVTRVSVQPVNGNSAQVLVWKGDPRSRRMDLAVPLADCGSGLGQVLAMLYVVSQSPSPRTILIDEPNSFLHPGALAALLEIFNEHTQHQYIITTHSPGVIAGARPTTLHLLETHGYETRVRRLQQDEISDQKQVLAAVGAGLADVFGPDKILWVEGPSEATSLPLIARKLGVHMARVAFLPLLATGDLEGRHGKLAAGVYQKMAQGIALVPPACAFVLDGEGRTPEDKTRISDAAPGKVHFLERRMFENYLLHPGALADLIASFGVTADQEAVRSWVITNGAAERFKTSASPYTTDWLTKVHGAKLIQAVVAALAEHHAFDKVRDTPRLVSWLLANEPEQLDGLSSLLAKLLA